jgi:MFS family permease
MLVLSPLGGALADRLDRRRLVLLTSAGQLVAVLALVGQAALGLDAVWLVLLLVAVHTSFGALGSPARRTFVPRLLPRDLVPGGLALTHIGFQAAMLLGPTVAGLVTAAWGLQVCYAVDAAAFLAAMYAVLRLPSLPPAPDADTTGSSIRRIADGMRFLVGRPALRGAFATDLFATVLAMPIALFPMVNEERFGGSPRTLGLFLTAVAVGGVLASIFSGAYTRALRPGRVMLVAAATWGLALAAFGLVDGLVATTLTLALAGAADTVSVVARGTITQLATPDALRGRISSLEGVVGVSGPDVGNVRAGLVAGWTSTEVALTLGGLMCVAGVATVAWRNPSVRRFTVVAETRPKLHV